jgi:uncharacterized protein YceK
MNPATHLRRLLVGSVALLSGCGTLWGTVVDGPAVYRGVRLDADILAGPLGPDDQRALWVMGALTDLPWSFALDTLLLPFTIVHALVTV